MSIVDALSEVAGKLLGCLSLHFPDEAGAISCFEDGAGRRRFFLGDRWVNVNLLGR